MNGINEASRAFKRIDEENEKDSFINRLHPLAKLIVTIVYIVAVVSVKDDEIYQLIMLMLYPVGVFILGGYSVKNAAVRLRIVLPFVAVMGILNIFFDHEVIGYYRSFAITGGMLSFVLLMIKGIMTVLSTYLLFVSTGIEKMCYALKNLHVPQIIVTEVLLIYRYAVFMIEEAGRMTDAYNLRAPGHKGIAPQSWGSFLGNFLLRSIDRAETVYESMTLRGFNGELLGGRRIKAVGVDYFYVLSFIIIIAVMRSGII